jgi:hypothetical protein
VGLSTGSSFTTQVGAAWSPAATWVDVQTGDFNGDGFTDLIGRDLQSGAWWVGLSDGHGHFTTTLWAVWSPAVHWVDVKVGDFTGDGKQDIAGRAQEDGSWWVGRSTGNGFVTSRWAQWAPDSASLHWVDVKVGDLNGDGKADLIGRDKENGQWWAAVSTGAGFVNRLWGQWVPDQPGTRDWVDVQLADFNGDGKADLAGRIRENGQWWVSSSGSRDGFTGNSLWAVWSPNVTWVDVKVGDFDGDGRKDIAGRVLQDGSWWVGRSTGTSFTTTAWGWWSPNVTWVDVRVGDFNGDGRDDLTGLVAQDGSWWTSVSTGTSFRTSRWGSWDPTVTWRNVHTGVFA